PGPLRGRAAWRLGRLWRRAGRVAEALRLWAGVVESASLPPLGLLADLAKLYEHYARDLGAALSLTCTALARAEADGLEATHPLVLGALRHRALRLERRILSKGRRVPNPPPDPPPGGSTFAAPLVGRGASSARPPRTRRRG
ncbi:MAG: hypothetical protein ACRELA_18380, partial [Candidatus Rokuibacteriota bacterium]